MRLALLLGAMWLSGAVGAERPAGRPWEKDWATNAGDCVALGEIPRGVTCKLYAHGRDGFEMRIYVYEERASRYMGAEAFFEVAERLCSSLSTPVKIEFHAAKLKRNVSIQPPNCQQPIIS